MAFPCEISTELMISLCPRVNFLPIYDVNSRSAPDESYTVIREYTKKEDRIEKLYRLEPVEDGA